MAFSYWTKWFYVDNFNENLHCQEQTGTLLFKCAKNTLSAVKIFERGNSIETVVIGLKR
jgi:hypothetical protein